MAAQRLGTISHCGTDLAGGLGARADRGGSHDCLGTDQDRIPVFVVDRRVVLVVGLPHAADRDASVAIGRTVLAHCDGVPADGVCAAAVRSEEHTSELQSLMPTSY